MRRGSGAAVAACLVLLAAMPGAQGEECGACPPWHECISGSCMFMGGCGPSALPGCGGCTCQWCTCQADPYCCTGAWDELCVLRCNELCGGCGKLTECGDGVCDEGEGCAACPGDCGSCPTPCGSVAAAGCCAGKALLACAGGQLVTTVCVEPGLDSCGWDQAAGKYACGGAGSDPSGQFPLACAAGPQADVAEDAVEPESCQGVPFEGCCDGSLVRWCDGSGLHALECGVNPPPLSVCGWAFGKGYYECGGEGADPSGEFALPCPAVKEELVGDQAAVPECKLGKLVSVGCQGVAFAGCCEDDGTLYFCQDGKVLCGLACAGLPAPSDTCGWKQSGVTGQYDCGGEGADPQGVHPFSCPPLQTAPDATGTDVSLPDVPCPHVPDGGCCEGSRLWWCEEGTEQSFDCATLAADPVFASYLYCGANPASGHADCLKKGDPSPPECTFGAEPAAEIAEVGGETFDVEMPEPGPEPVDLAGAEEQSAAEAAPDLWSKDHGQFIVEGAEAQVEPGRGGGGCGCSFAAPGPGSGGMTVCLALLAALVVARRVARRGPRLEQGE